jgi:hypothetical protein
LLERTLARLILPDEAQQFVNFELARILNTPEVRYSGFGELHRACFL